MPDEKLEVIFT